MKNIIILFLFFSSVVFSQNYYPLDKAPVPDTENPSIPLNLVASNITQTTVDLSWTPATDNVAVTNYRIYNNGNLLIASTGNVTSYTLTGLNANTAYNLTIRAIDAANNESGDSNNANFNTAAIVTPDTENPSIPLNLVASNITQTTVDLSWTPATDNVAVTNYRIYNNGNLLVASTGNVTSYTLTGLNANTAYNLTIRAIDAANNESGDSNNANFNTAAIVTPDTENPSIPLNLVASNITQTTVDLSWTPATDNVAVTNYRIYNNGNLLIASTGNVTSYMLTGLNANTAYNLTIRALDAAGNESNDSNNANFNTAAIVTPDTENPSIPLNLVASNITQTTVDLSWTPATDNVAVTNYRIYNNGNLLIASTGNVTSYILTGLNANTAYNLTIRAIDAANNESGDSNNANFNTAAIVTPDTENPSIPLNLVASNITQTTVDLSWTPATDNVAVTNYRIYNNGNLLVASTGNVTSYTLTGLNANTAYNLTIRALDAAGNESNDSNNANFNTAAIVTPDTENPSIPLNLVASNITQTTVDLSWTPATDNVAVTNYRIYNNGNLLIASTGNVTSYTLTGLNANTAYNLTIRAIDAANNESGDSNNEVFITLEPDTTSPTNPLNLVASNITQTTADLSWTAATDNVGVTNYRVYNSGNLLVASTGNITNYLITGLTPETNYNLTIRAIDDADNESSDSNVETFTTNSVSLTDNMPVEIDYFAATYVAPENASTIQSVLNTDGAVRLGAGDYSGSGTLTLSDNMRLYGYPQNNGTIVGNITIPGGSTNIRIEGINADIDFAPGGVTSNVKLLSVYNCLLTCINCTLEDSEFVDISRGRTTFDCSSSGYFRNNIFKRVFSQSIDNHVTMIGNITTPSYGNIELSRVLLTSQYNTTEYNTLDNHTLLGADSEYWSQVDGTGRAAFYVRNVGKLKMFNTTGFAFTGAPDIDLEADEILMNRKYLNSSGNGGNIIRPGSKFLGINIRNTIANANEANTLTLQAHHNNTSDLTLNGTATNPPITGQDAADFTAMIQGTEYTPIAKPNLPTLPNPTGANWATNRTGQADQSAAIQALIDTNGIAELDAGIYYISQPLVLTNKQGIIGKGTGKTAIVGITDDFPLVLAQDDLTGGSNLTGVNYTLAYLTLQGGSAGLEVNPIGKENVFMQMSNIPWKNLVFRDQNYGIHLNKFYAVDNTFFANLNFVNCNKGIFQDIDYTQPGNTLYPTCMYVDKTVFYRCQFINCGIGLDMIANRANNLNAWIDCKFDGNDIALNCSQSNGLYVSNSTFTNHTGAAVIGGNAVVSFYGCDFSGNGVSNVVSANFHAEGCNFLDTGVSLQVTNKRAYLWNNIINSTVPAIFQGTLINNEVLNRSDLSKVMVDFVNSTPRTIIDGAADAYPQLLVKQ